MKRFFTKIRLLQWLCLHMAFIVVLSGCGKYEDGPDFSLKSKKNRLAGTYKWAKYIITQDGFVDDATQRMQNSTITFETNGDVKLHSEEKNNSADYSGNWFFADDKLKLKVSISATTQFWDDWYKKWETIYYEVTFDFAILRLKDKDIRLNGEAVIKTTSSSYTEIDNQTLSWYIEEI